MEDVVKFSKVTGLELTRLSGPPGTAAMQYVNEGEGILVFPGGTLRPGVPMGVPLVRAALWETVKAKRSAVIDAGAFIGGGKFVQTDRDSRLNLAGLALAALIEGDDFVETLTTSDNTTIPVGRDEMIGVALAARRHISDAHARSRELRGLISDENATVADLLKVDIFAGWPGEPA